ncbi:MAG: hypothetical protein ACYSR5_03045 [Planctomycetota bacterium]
MASIVVIAVILGCAAALYLKCTLVRSFATLIAVISAAIAAFAYFELLANLFISRGKLIPWAQSISFVLLFIVARKSLLWNLHRPCRFRLSTHGSCDDAPANQIPLSALHRGQPRPR